jgi:hypothetical protein
MRPIYEFILNYQKCLKYKGKNEIQKNIVNINAYIFCIPFTTLLWSKGDHPASHMLKSLDYEDNT